jgi:hypothetical protein
MKTQTCAIIISAWKANPVWLLEALESVEQQVRRKGWRYQVRLGVDGCEETAGHLQEAGVPFYYSPVNVGVYVMRNSLIQLKPADAYAIFDADDQMLPQYLSMNLANVEAGHISGADRVEISREGTRVKPFKSGVCVIPHQAWLRLGGYREERLSSDTDFVMRAKYQHIQVKRVRTGLYVRRRHPDSLTSAKTTGAGSAIRQQIRAKHSRLRARRRYVASMVTTPLELIKPQPKE